MKRTLVFSGGGSRGAYEIGAWQAFQEAGVRFQGVYGTSIGAINALLFAQGDLDAAIRVWDNITTELVTGIPEKDFVAIDSMISRKRDLVPFLLEHANQLMLDMKPLEKLLREMVDERRVRAGRLALGMMTVRFPSLAPAPVRLAQIPEGRLIDFALASASCFPVFAPRYIDGERYVDGGYLDNLPIDMALRDGAQEIIAVDIHPRPTHPEYLPMPFLTTIAPLSALGGFLDFDQAHLRRSRALGYYDAMKRLGRLDGIRYSFRRVGGAGLLRTARQYAQAVAGFDARAVSRAALSAQSGGAPLISVIAADAPGRVLSWKEVYLRGLELAAMCVGIEELAVYEPDALTRRILEMLRADDHGADLELSERNLQILARRGDRALLGCLYRRLRARGGAMDAGFIRLSAAYPAQTAAAMYLIEAEERGGGTAGSAQRE